VAGTTVKDDNEVWPDFGRNPKGEGGIFPIASSLVAKIHPVFVAPRFSHSKKSAPLAAVLIALAGPGTSAILCTHN
jgi:hypothetical protein